MSPRLSLRRLLKQGWITVLFACGALRWARRRLAQEQAIIVLMFHRVMRAEQIRRTSSLPGIIVTDETFDALSQYIGRSAHVVPVVDARPVPPPGNGDVRLMLTFDDGWEDNATVAYPVASRHGVPFTIFICPGLVDREQPFWPERVIAASTQPLPATNELVERLKRMAPDVRQVQLAALLGGRESTSPSVDRTMDVATVRRLHEGGVSFGSHSYSHEILTYLSAKDLSTDLERSRRSVTEMLEAECRILAYPNGNTSPEVKAAAAEAGYTLAFSTDEGAWMRDTDPYQIPRVNMWEQKITSPTGRFSPLAFEYAIYWRPFISWVFASGADARVARFSGFGLSRA